MPHKFNAHHRHKFAKKQYRVTNWRMYNESLRNRGDLTIWITADAGKPWAAPRRRSRGGQRRYTDLAITLCLTLGIVYKLPLRQTQGLMRSISKLMQLEVPVPDFSTLSRRGRYLILPVRPKTKRTDPIHLAVDSTGLKIFGVGEWLQKKHKTGTKRKKWRKLPAILIMENYLVTTQHGYPLDSLHIIRGRKLVNKRCFYANLSTAIN